MILEWTYSHQIEVIWAYLVNWLLAGTWNGLQLLKLLAKISWVLIDFILHILISYLLKRHLFIIPVRHSEFGMRATKTKSEASKVLVLIDIGTKTQGLIARVATHTSILLSFVVDSAIRLLSLWCSSID